MNYASLQAKLHGMEYKVPGVEQEERSSFTEDQNKILEDEMFAAIARKQREFEEKRLSG